MIKGVLPKSARFSVVRRGKTKATFVYEEGFPRDCARMVKRTVQMLQAAVGKNPQLKVTQVGRCGIRATGTTEYSAIATMIVTEFFCWSKVGQLTLADLIAGSVAGAAAANGWVQTPEGGLKRA